MSALVRERWIIGFGLLLLLGASLACNAFAGRPDTLLPPPPLPTATVEGPAPEGGGGPGIAATVTLPGETIPENLPRVRILVDLNIRSGPGVAFRRAGFLLSGDTAQVLRRDEATGWWQIVCPAVVDSPECWVSGGSEYTRLEEPAVTPQP
jgi:hypothetical protein